MLRQLLALARILALALVFSMGCATDENDFVEVRISGQDVSTGGGCRQQVFYIDATNWSKELSESKVVIDGDKLYFYFPPEEVYLLVAWDGVGDPQGAIHFQQACGNQYMGYKMSSPHQVVINLILDGYSNNLAYEEAVQADEFDRRTFWWI